MNLTININLSDTQIAEIVNQLAQTLQGSVAKEKYYNTTEACKYLDITRKTLYSHIELGLLKATKIGRGFRVSHTDLQNYLQGIKTN